MHTNAFTYGSMGFKHKNFYLLRINHNDCIRKIIFCFKSNKSGRISEELRSDFAKFLIFKVRDMIKKRFKINNFGNLRLICIFELIKRNASVAVVDDSGNALIHKLIGRYQTDEEGKKWYTQKNKTVLNRFKCYFIISLMHLNDEPVFELHYLSCINIFYYSNCHQKMYSFQRHIRHPGTHRLRLGP